MGVVHKPYRLIILVIRILNAYGSGPILPTPHRFQNQIPSPYPLILSTVILLAEVRYAARRDRWRPVG